MFCFIVSASIVSKETTLLIHTHCACHILNLHSQGKEKQYIRKSVVDSTVNVSVLLIFMIFKLDSLI